MKKATVWTGTYRDIDYTIICEEKYFNEYWWFAKVKWVSKRMPVLYYPVEYSSPKEYVSYRYDNDPRLHRVSQLVEINGLEVITRPGDATEYYTITWDYMHYWQNGRNYDETLVFYDIRDVIDALIGAFEEEV